MATILFTAVIFLSLLLFVFSVGFVVNWFMSDTSDDPAAERYSLARDTRLRRLSA